MVPYYYLSDVRLDRAHLVHVTTCLYVYPPAILVYMLGYGEVSAFHPQTLTPIPQASPVTENATDQPQLPRVLVTYPPAKISLFLVSYAAIPSH